MLKRSLWTHLVAAVFWCCCLSSSAQTQNTYLLGLSNDHYSTIESVASPGNYIHVGTVAPVHNSPTHDIHAFELDGAGNIVWEQIYSTPNDERAFHVDLSPGGYIIAGYVNNGSNEVLLMEIDLLGNIIQQNSFPDSYFNMHAQGLHVRAVQFDPSGGFIVAGLASTGFQDASLKVGMLLKVDPALNPQWLRYYDSPNGINDYDMGSHALEVPSKGYFMSGSCNKQNGDQQVYGVMVDYAGAFLWDTEYTDNTGNGHYSVGASAIYDAQTDQVIQLCNLSIIHHWGITTYDVTTGLRDLNRSFRVFSQLGYANVQGFRLMQAPNPDNLIVAGHMRDHQWPEVDEAGNPTGNWLSASPPWMCEVDKMGTTFLWDNMYLIPSPGYTASVDIFNAFSAGQQPRILHPEMAVLKSDGLGYWLNAYNNNGSGLYDLEVFETDLVGANPCSSTPLGLTFAPKVWFDEQNADDILEVPSVNPSFVTSVPHNAQIQSCAVPNPCVVDADFSITDLGDCCYQFDDLTPDPAANCAKWDIFDSAGNLIANGNGWSFIFCFPVSGTYQICYTDCCTAADGTQIFAQSCQILIVDCEGCTPDANFLIEDIGDCCYTFTDLTPLPAGMTCPQNWTIFDPATGVQYCSGTGSSITCCFPTNGIYQVCFDDCCVNPDGTISVITHCEDITVECCDIQPDLIVEENGCVWTFTLVNNGTTPDSDVCVWVDVLGGIVPLSAATWTVDFTGQCTFYGVCYDMFCCDGDVNNDPPAICVDFIVDCCCEPDANFIITDLGDCCYLFEDLTPSDPATPNNCDIWEIIDPATGIVIANNVGDSWTYCFQQSGSFVVCHTDCCTDAFGNTTTDTQCQDIFVDCCDPALITPSVDIQVNGCVYTFTVLNLGPGNSSDLCVAGDPFGAGVIVPLASATWTVDFSGQCTGWGYCFTVFCCDDDPSNGVTLCIDGYADCCCNADFVLTQDVNCCVTVEALNPGLCLDATGVATADVNGDGVIDGADTQLLLANGCCQFDMGDGTIYNGPGPFTHCYAQNGVYNVCYTTCCLLPDGTLVTDTQCQLVDINCCNVPLFDFSWSAFNDPLCPTGCAIAFDCPVLGPEFCVTWDFGDGTVTSGLANCPIHCYQGCGTYTVCLTVYCCNDPSQSLTVCHEVTPDCCTLPFDWFETVVDCEACFSPIFEGPCPTDCLFWDFGDGTLGTGLNPCHDYGQSGTYTVCLTACCCDNIDAAGNVIDPSLCTTICKDITVNCCTVPDFDFSWGYSTNPLCPDGCSIGFNCPVLGPDLCVHWDFGDGTTYDTPNACPIHCYELCGVYEVCLTVYCCNDPSQAITVCHQVVADCCCDVDPEFTVTPLGDCCFEFNDPTPSLNSPQLNNCGVFEIFDLTGNLIASGLGDSWIYCFTTSGSYIVCHTDCCINPDGTLTQETFCIDLLVDCPCPQPTDLEITAVSGDNCEWGFCVLGGFDISKHCATWDFGDGTVQNFPLDICPIHQYLCDGIYDVCVTVYCCDDPSISTTVCTTILVDCPCSLPQVDFVVDIDECSVNTDVIILLDTPCPDDYCFSWDFGDGSPAVSGPSASHTYNADGVYVICLTVYCCDDPSISYIICQTVEVDCPCELPVDLDILAVTTDDCQWAFCVEGGINVNEHCVTWDYGDGIVENHPIDFCPLHQYLCDGVYTVCATVYCCNDPSISVTVCTTIVVDCPCTLPDVTLVYNTYDDCSITANALIDSPCPDNYCFTWDFGDGSILVNGPATVSHTYGASGWYTVCVTVFCCDEPLLPGITTCVDIYIDCGCTLPSFVDFSLDVIGCTVDVSAFYTDDYSGNICFEWNWGDGTTSTGDTGSHTYSQSGAYLICLNVFCCDNPNEVITICHEVCVVCPCDIINPDFEVTIDGCTACFNPTISGLPAGSDICYDFHFDMANDPFIGTGDMNPCYTYDASGTYTVCMHIWCCNDLSTIIEVCKEITVVCDCTLPQVDIAYTFDGCTGVFQVVGSDVNSACYSWDFGDGTTGSGTSPSHTYGASGTYTVCLTVYCCDDTTIAYTICLIVTVDCPACDLPSGAGFDCVINNCTLAVGAFYTDDYDGQLCFLYEWGDGTPPAFGEIAAHTYFASGTYTVCLTIFCCNDPLVNMVVCKEVTVECDGNCPEPCELDPRFVWNTDPFTYAQGCCVHFTDVSVAGTYTNITAWSWDFGDGTTSNQQNPTHCYTNDNAVHTVCLTITGTSPEGTCTETFCWDVHCGCSDTCPTDVNHDGVTNTQDLLILLASWTQLCP